MSKQTNQIAEILYHHPGHLKGVGVIQELDNFILTGGQAGRICIWDRELKNEIACIYAHNSKITDIQKINNSRFFISSSQDLELKIWSLDSFELIKTIKAHSSTIIGAKPWKNFVISGGRDHVLKKWSFVENNLIEVARLKIPDMERFYISGDFIIISNHDGLLSILEAEDFKFIKYLFIENSKLIKAIKKATKYLQSFYKKDPHTLLFNMSRANGIPSILNKVDKEFLILGHQFGLVSLWNKQKYKFTDAFFTQDNHITGIEVEDDVLYVTSLDGSIVQFNIVTKEPIRNKYFQSRPLSLLKSLLGNIIIGLESGEILQLDTYLEITNVHSNINAISSICISPESIALAYSDGVISLIDHKELATKDSKKVHEKQIVGIFYYKDRLISVSEDKSVFILDMQLNVIKEFTLPVKPSKVIQARHYISLTPNLVLDLKKDEIIKGEISKQTEEDLIQYNLLEFKYINGDVSILINRKLLEKNDKKLLNELYSAEGIEAIHKLVKTFTNKKYFQKSLTTVMRVE